MSLIIAWVLFPLVLVVIGAGWGGIVERASGSRISPVLVIPLGLAAALVVAGTITSFDATAKAATPIVAAGAVAGLVFARPTSRIGRWPLLAALAVLVVYGAPVLLSGEATFTGYVKLDDTATWFNIIDHVMAHARSVSGELPSTFSLVFSGDVGPDYPLGAFILPGVGRALVGQDIAWVFQPYMACCAAALSLCIYSLLEPVTSSPRFRALAAFLAAQSALLYGYELWGGVKELTAAFLLGLGVALTAVVLERRPQRWREALPLAVAAGALIQTLGVGAGGWLVPAVAVLLGVWLWRERGARPWRSSLRALGWLTAFTVVFVIPVWLVVGDFFSNKGGTFAGLFSAGSNQATKLGNLFHPVSVFQLAGIWPVSDFRLTAPTVPSVILIGLVLLAAAGGIWAGVRSGRLGVALYVSVALGGCAIFYLGGTTPWVQGKTLAISSPALLTAALAGAGLLWSRMASRAGSGERAGAGRLAGFLRGRSAGVAGALLTGVLAGGVLWSNALGYGHATLAPREALAELVHINGLLTGKGPTFVNVYEPYADRHFLRAGAPVDPAEYRYQSLPTEDGAILTKAAAADIDSFPLSTLEPFPSLVTPNWPSESRPPSSYALVWKGIEYSLWERKPNRTQRILEHVPLGESVRLPYCGHAENGSYKPLCPTSPVGTPPCPQIEALGRKALAENGLLLAYQRPAPIVARGDQTLWPAKWLHYSAEHTLVPTTPGRAVSHIALASGERYELWLGGAFSRGFEVSVDGHSVGSVKNQLRGIGGYAHVADMYLKPGVHTITLTYPSANLTPGSAENELTSLTAISLEPMQHPATEMLSVVPSEASLLCGRPLDWIEIVTAS